jgi:hypothetical protein
MRRLPPKRVPIVDALTTACVKLPKLKNEENGFLRLTRIGARSDIAIAINAIRREICSINFHAADFLHSQDPKRTK